MKRLGYLLILLSVSLIISSCGGHRIKIIYPSDNVYDMHGKVNDYSIDDTKKKVVQFSSLHGIPFIMDYTPKGKIEKIIRDNPDWEFIFYVYGEQADTSELISALKKYQCNFPVIFDYKNEFQEKNFGDVRYGGIGFICDRNNKVVGLSEIGTTMSFFDQEFAKAKRICR
jgi:hypothetical protein